MKLTREQLDLALLFESYEVQAKILFNSLDKDVWLKIFPYLLNAQDFSQERLRLFDSALELALDQEMFYQLPSKEVSAWVKQFITQTLKYLESIKGLGFVHNNSASLLHFLSWLQDRNFRKQALLKIDEICQTHGLNSSIRQGQLNIFRQQLTHSLNEKSENFTRLISHLDALPFKDLIGVLNENLFFEKQMVYCYSPEKAKTNLLFNRQEERFFTQFVIKKIKQKANTDRLKVLVEKFHYNKAQDSWEYQGFNLKHKIDKLIDTQ